MFAGPTLYSGSTAGHDPRKSPLMQQHLAECYPSIVTIPHAVAVTHVGLSSLAWSNSYSILAVFNCYTLCSVLCITECAFDWVDIRQSRCTVYWVEWWLMAALCYLWVCHLANFSLFWSLWKINILFGRSWISQICWLLPLEESSSIGCLKAVMSLNVQRNRTTFSCSFRMGAIFTKNQTGVPESMKKTNI